MVRMIGQKYTEAWGQQVVVDHRAGAGMTIGIELTAQATPDGHTMAVVNPSHAINATLYSPSCRTTRCAISSPITVAATQPYAVCVTNSLPAKNVKDVIALAKAKPRELNFASSGPGSASHLAGEMFVSHDRHRDDAHPVQGHRQPSCRTSSAGARISTSTRCSR